MLLHVIVRYADYSRFDGDWVDAPKYEVQTICYLDGEGNRVLRHGGDYYNFEEGGVVPLDKISLLCLALKAGWDHTQHNHPEISIVEWAVDNGIMIGSYVDPLKWKRIYKLAKSDRGLVGG
jgi:hypothetical protein